MTCILVAAICNLPEASASDLGDDQSRYLFWLCGQRCCTTAARGIKIWQAIKSRRRVQNAPCAIKTINACHNLISDRMYSTTASLKLSIKQGRQWGRDPSLGLFPVVPVWASPIEIKSTLLLFCEMNRVRVIGHLYSALLWDELIAKDAQIWPVIARGSHSFTCHPLTNHTCLEYAQ